MSNNFPKKLAILSFTSLVFLVFSFNQKSFCMEDNDQPRKRNIAQPKLKDPYKTRELDDDFKGKTKDCCNCENCVIL